MKIRRNKHQTVLSAARRGAAYLQKSTAEVIASRAGVSSQPEAVREKDFKNLTEEQKIRLRGAGFKIP